jgi:hypothetical protein
MTEAAVVKLSRFSMQHGAISRGGQIIDAAGAIGDPFRRLSLVERWERSGFVTAQMRAAGDTFHDLFQLAALDPLRSASMERGGGMGASREPHGSMAARDRVAAAFRALGGQGSPAGCGAWFVIGCEYSIREWMAREAWRGRPLHHRQARLLLHGVLATLEKHFEGGWR